MRSFIRLLKNIKRKRMKKDLFCFIALLFIANGALFGQANKAADRANYPDWESAVLIPELSPQFYQRKGKTPDQLVLGIKTDDHNNLHGYWKTAVPVEGGKYYAFSVVKKVTNIKDIRKATPVNIIWGNKEGKPVLRDKDYADKRFAIETFKPGAQWPWKARAEIPYKATQMEDGKIKIASFFQAPSNADYAVVQLHLRYYANASVEWSHFSLQQIEPPVRKKIKVASVFLPPDNSSKVSTPREATALFLPYIKEAAEKGVRLICLPEWLTKAYTRLPIEKVAEPVPGGPSVQYFVNLAKQNNMYIVAGLVECDQDTLYNTAILVGPEGYMGKYRKAGLTLMEANELGLTPGHKYPVFDTEIGRVGIMTCYDVYFPEVARNLSKNGAQIIAMPIAGGNPVLAKARAIENQVYLITSTYSERKHWLKTAIYDYDGKMLGATNKPGTMAIAEVMISDLPKYWAHLGNLKADLYIQEP